MGFSINSFDSKEKKISVLFILYDRILLILDGRIGLSFLKVFIFPTFVTEPARFIFFANLP
jgi:hypothetical protein